MTDLPPWVHSSHSQVSLSSTSLFSFRPVLVGAGFCEALTLCLARRRSKHSRSTSCTFLVCRHGPFFVLLPLNSFTFFINLWVWSLWLDSLWVGCHWMKVCLPSMRIRHHPIDLCFVQRICHSLATGFVGLPIDQVGAWPDCSAAAPGTQEKVLATIHDEANDLKHV